MPSARTGRRRSFKDYKPVQNHLNKTAPIGNWMYETYDAEYEFVRRVPNKHVWTVLDGPGSSCYVVAGWHYVNRLGYIVTELPWTSDDIEYRV